jgi:hypothetical protein
MPSFVWHGRWIAATTGEKSALLCTLAVDPTRILLLKRKIHTPARHVEIRWGYTGQFHFTELFPTGSLPGLREDLAARKGKMRYNAPLVLEAVTPWP